MKYLLVSLLFINSVFACPVEPHEFMLSQMRGFSPPGISESGISEEEFNETLNRVKDRYEKEFNAFGLEVDFNADWNNTWFNAQTGWVNKNKVKFFFSGELARGKYMTRDALMYVACHEVGHHFGGLPKKSWASAEGQSDYYAAVKCMRDLLQNDPENGIMDMSSLHDGVAKKCSEVYSNADEYQLCLRVTKAGEDMVKAFIYKRNRKEQTESLLFRRQLVAEETKTDYPSYECRADTAFQGAICAKGPEIPVSFANEYEGYCHERNGDTFGMRPKCWFKPNL